MASLQATTALMGVSLAVLILYLIRRDHLYLMHGLFWVAVAAAAAVLGAWPGLIDRLALWTGVGYPPALLLLLACMVLLLKALHADMVNTRIERDVRRLNQRLALFEADLEALRARCAAAQQAYQRSAEALGKQRARAAQQLSKDVSRVMQQLALAGGRFEVALLPLEGGSAQGLESVDFRIAGAGNGPARPLAKVASGGELSRISLAIQVLTSRSASVPTLIFDEVDVGIGGGVAEIVGRLLRELGGERQVLCVTHLPQVAAQADWQWQVSKATRNGVTLSAIQPLDDASRVQEIARMLGGVEITDITRQHASELLRKPA